MKQRAVSKDALRNYITAYRDEIRKLWDRHATIPALLAEYYPEIWDRVRACRYEYQPYQKVDDARLWTARPRACHQIPWCIPCTHADNVRRTFKAMDRLWRVTPPAERLSVYHFVSTAPLTDAGDGWGAQARYAPGKFFAVTARSLDRIFGPGAGGFNNYQDFGERPFHKPHPHMDCVINGYRLQQDHAQPVPEPALQFGGADRIKEILRGHAMAFGLDAWAPNYHVRRVRGPAQVFQTVKYSLRHMVDFANFEYRDGWVWYSSYREASPERLRPTAFVDWLDEYRDRLGQYGPRTGVQLRLHRRFGYLGKGMFRIASRIIGGEPPAPPKDCQCMVCQEWRPVFDEDFGQHGVAVEDLRTRWGLRSDDGPLVPSPDLLT